MSTRLGCLPDKPPLFPGPALQLPDSRVKTKAFLLLSLAVLACAKDGTSPPPGGEPVSILVIAPQSVPVVNTTMQLTAYVYDGAGKRLPNATVQWESLQPTVASVSNTGVVTTLTPGTATIRATAAGDKSGEANLTVEPNPCTSPLSLAVGQVRQISGPAAVSCITLAATSGPSDFLFVTANATLEVDNLASYSVAQPQLGPPASRVASAAPSDVQAFVEQAALQYMEGAEARIRSQERTVLRQVRPLRGGAGDALRSISPDEPSLAAAPAEGATVTYRVPDINATDLCVTYKDVSAVVKKVSAHAVIAQDESAPAGGFTQSDFDAIAAEFENLIFPTDTLHFGGPTDRNADGHITILYTSEVNRATPAGRSGFIAGFFWGGDLVKKTEYQQIGRNCPQTNEQEIFYLLVPDPSGTINGNPRSVATVRQNTRGTIAHEFQHMINQGLRLLNPAVDSSETIWLNEALSHMAEEIVGRAQRGFSDFQNLSFADVSPSGSQAQDDYNAFFRQNLLRFRPWMQRPDTSSPISNRARDQLAPRGAGWMLVRYLTDHYSNNNARAYLRHLVAGPDIGLRNILQWSGGAQFDDILRGFLVSMYTDELTVPNLATEYTVRSWRVRDVMQSVNGGVFPLLITPLPTTIPTQSLSGSGNFFRLTRTASSPASSFRMLPSGASAENFEGARVYVVRLQ